MKLKWTLFILLTLIFTGCKQEEWKDWKIHNEAWLVQNASQEGIIKTHTGLQYKVIRPGVGNQRPDDLKQVLINYRGTLITGIDANGDLIAGREFEVGKQTVMGVNTVIAGFAEGLKKMHKSGKYILYIPYQLGYLGLGQGAKGTMGYIPPYSTLIYEVELIDVF
jgi:FKBP-type peptidyl-prolyl cis-trans isomerase